MDITFNNSSNVDHTSMKCIMCKNQCDEYIHHLDDDKVNGYAKWHNWHKKAASCNNVNGRK